MAITKVYGDQMNEESMGQFNNRPIVSATHFTNTTAYSGTIKFSEEHVDTHDAFNHTTGIFTCPYAGFYFISYTGFTDTGAVSGALQIRKNGVKFGSRNYQSAGGYNATAIQLVVPCAVGDTLSIFAEMTMHGNDNSQISIIYYGTA